MRDGLAWLTHRQPSVELRRDAYRFVLVEGIRPDELVERFGTGPLELVASERDFWDLPFSRERSAAVPSPGSAPSTAGASPSNRPAGQASTVPV